MPLTLLPLDWTYDPAMSGSSLVTGGHGAL